MLQAEIDASSAMLGGGRYVAGHPGKHACSPGYCPIVSASECQVAAGILYPGGWNGRPGPDSLGNNSMGCFHDGGSNGGLNVFFNTHPTGGADQPGDRTICKHCTSGEHSETNTGAITVAKPGSQNQGTKSVPYDGTTPGLLAGRKRLEQQLQFAVNNRPTSESYTGPLGWVAHCGDHS